MGDLGDEIAKGYGCHLDCHVTAIATKLPTKEEMLKWLKDQSHLSEDYFDRILRVTYDDAVNGDVKKFTVHFDETANCFMAIDQIRNRVVRGKYRIWPVRLSCPKGELEQLRLVPRTSDRIKNQDIVDVLKEYGVIVTILDIRWRDLTRRNCSLDVSTGDVNVVMFTAKDVPELVEVNEKKCDVHKFYCHVNDAKLLQLAWQDSKSSVPVDYSGRKFHRCDTELGCKIVCNVNLTESGYSPTDLYDWLTTTVYPVGVFNPPLRTLKKIGQDEYHIISRSDANCLQEIQKLKNGYIVDATCPKAKFVDVAIVPISTQKQLPRKMVSDELEKYGKILDEEGIRASVELDASGNILRDFRCQMLMTKEPDPKITIDGVDVEVIIEKSAPIERDEKLLNKLWKDLKK